MLYLASASPRRTDLLKLAGFRFTVEPAEIDEADVSGRSCMFGTKSCIKKSESCCKTASG